MIELKDDGRGIDPQKLKETAIRKKMLTAAEAAHLSRRELLELIYRPGFTTASSVTEVSGRGVGMDAVMTSIRDALDGSIAIHSEVGKGTSFSIQVPNQNGA
jgi:two-component system chemotaxis sensor kinase CheA